MADLPQVQDPGKAGAWPGVAVVGDGPMVLPQRTPDGAPPPYMETPPVGSAGGMLTHAPGGPGGVGTPPGGQAHAKEESPKVRRSIAAMVEDAMEVDVAGRNSSGENFLQGLRQIPKEH